MGAFTRQPIGSLYVALCASGLEMVLISTTCYNVGQIQWSANHLPQGAFLF